MNIRIQKKATNVRRNLCNLAIAIAVMILIIPNASAFASTTKVSASIVNGRWNPFKSDGGKGKLTFCTDHKYPDADFCYSKCTMTLEVGSNKTSKVKKASYATGVNVSYTVPAYCDKNSGSKTISADSPSGDSAKVKARVSTLDCFCGQCVLEGVDGYDAYSNYTSDWVSE